MRQAMEDAFLAWIQDESYLMMDAFERSAQLCQMRVLMKFLEEVGR